MVGGVRGSVVRFLSGAALAAVGAALVGCADVRPPAPASPTAASPPFAVAPASVGTPAPATDAAEAGSTEAVVVPAAYGGEEASDDEDGDDSDEVHDDTDEDTSTVDFTACLDRGPGSPPHCPQYKWSSPLEKLSRAEVEDKVKHDLASVGPISLGAPNRGRLFNGVRMPESELWKFSDPGNAYGTQETIDSISRAIKKVHDKFPGARKVYIGHISAKNGGWLRPHKSHQAGRDVDLSYFYNEDKLWYAVANDKNLDREKTWAFVKAFLEDPNTEMILIDTSLQRLLYDWASKNGEDKDMLDRVFQISGKSKWPIIRHAKGHATHVHVRFFSPSAQASGRLAGDFLPKPVDPPKPTRGKGKHKNELAKGEPTDPKDIAKRPPGRDEDFEYHRARSGDTLDALARKYGSSVAAIKAANGLKSNELKIGKTYRIPRAEPAAGNAASTGSRTAQRPAAAPKGARPRK